MIDAKAKKLTNDISMGILSFLLLQSVVILLLWGGFNIVSICFLPMVYFSLICGPLVFLVWVANMGFIYLKIRLYSVEEYENLVTINFISLILMVFPLGLLYAVFHAT